MVIDLTKEQYRLLVDLVYLGEWTVNAFRDPQRSLTEYEDTLREVLSNAEAAGYPELADPETLDPTEGLERDREIRRFIDEYNDDSFWHELLERLALRDLERELGFRAVRDMDEDDRENRLDALKERYEKELETHGLDNLVFKGFSE